MIEFFMRLEFTLFYIIKLNIFNTGNKYYKVIIILKLTE